MSARLITLAINIAMMGFILVEGISSSLRSALPGALQASQLHALAEAIAAGNVTSLPETSSALSSLASSKAVFHQALVHGFGLVMLYGGIGVWILAALSFAIFGSTRASFDTADVAIRDAQESELTHY